MLEIQFGIVGVEGMPGTWHAAAFKFVSREQGGCSSKYGCWRFTGHE
jgi:hypothetical protein